MDSEKMKVVYTVVEREKGKSFWVKLGVGFVNHDGSLNLKLDAVPVNGTLQVRDWEPREERAGDAAPPPPPDGRRRTLAEPPPLPLA